MSANEQQIGGSHYKVEAGQEEHWRAAPGLPGYEVSSLGAVRSWRPINKFSGPRTTPLLIKQQPTKDGYWSFTAHTDYGPKTVYVASLICEAWHGPRPPLNVVRHLNGNHYQNREKNLAWGTQVDNAADSRRHRETMTKVGDVYV